MRLKIDRWREVALENIDIYRLKLPDPGSPKGNYGISDIESFVKTALVGYWDEALFLLPRATQWIDEAIAEGTELYGWDSHYANLHQARAVGEWLMTGQTMPHYFDQARRLKENDWRVNKEPMQDIVRDSLADYMAFAILGDGEPGHDVDCYEAGIEIYEYWVRDTNISLKKLLKPREFGYALCRHYARNEFDGEELLAAGHRMLKANLAEEWFGMGQSMRAATWLMVVNWHSAPYIGVGKPHPTPLETILMAYDDMPGVIRPF